MTGNPVLIPDKQLQTPGAGPSRPRPVDILIPPNQLYLSSERSAVRARTPTRADTICEELELGIYLQADAASVKSGPPSPSNGIFARRGSTASIISKVSSPHQSFFLVKSTWRTDIITFCSHARADPALGKARITHIQARKSYRPPFLHEYLLVFFTAAGNQRFVMRIDRLGKVGFTPSGDAGPQQGATTNTAIQEVGIYHIQDSQISVNSDDGPWLEMDGRWGSRPVATLATWEAVRMSGEHVSHHIQTVAQNRAHCPRLQDVSRLLESILIEMPNYHLTTANCYMMTRSSLILLQRCYPSVFACYLGAMSSEVVPSSDLAEPVWVGLIRWYLPFVVVFFLIYIPLLVVFYRFYGLGWGCSHAPYEGPGEYCHMGRFVRALNYGMHSLLDAPVPVGMMHAYMTSLEVQMNKSVLNLSAQFFAAQGPNCNPAIIMVPPFGVMFDNALVTLAAWWMLGAIGAISVFLASAFERGILVAFCVLLVLCVWFNLKFGDDLIGISEDGVQRLGEILGPTQPPAPDPLSAAQSNQISSER